MPPTGRDDTHAPPWRRNPSSWAQRIPIAVLALVGTGISVYLGLYQWRVIDGVWDPFFGAQTERVLDSGVSEWMRGVIGLPDAILGAFAYLGDAIFGLAGSTRRWRSRPWLVIVFGLDVIPLGIVSIVLVVLQGTVVGSWCTLCLATAVISLALIVLAWDEVHSSVLYLVRVWRRHGRARPVWDALWGRRPEDAVSAFAPGAAS